MVKTVRQVALFCLLLSWLPPASVGAIQRAYVADNNQAVELLERGEFKEGIELLKQALERKPGDEQIALNLLYAYQIAGRQLLQQERYSEVPELLLEAQEYADEQREFWTMRGYALLRLKQHDEAEVDLLEARSMGEPDADILFILGELYYSTDRMYEAYDVLESALLHDSNRPAIQQMLEKVRRELAVEAEMEKEYGGHFVITFDGYEDADLGSEVLEALEEAYLWVGSQIDHYPEQRVTVILYSRQQFSDLTDSPEWAGGLYDGKIRLPVGGIAGVTERVRALLYHEYMHVVLRDIAGDNLPFWLSEGLAELAEAEISPREPELLPLAQEQEKLFSLRTLEGSFRRLNNQQAALAYEQSHAVVRYLVEEYGWYQISEMLLALGEGQSIDKAIEEAFGIYGLNYQALEQQWQEAG